MDLTIVVPLDSGPDQTLRCLTSLAALPELPAHEVVLVDDATTGLEELLLCLDGDVEIVRHERRRGLAAAIASGVERATTETVVVLAGAREVDPAFLAPLLAALRGDGVAAATAGSGPAVATSAVAAAVSHLRHPVVGHPVPDGLAVADLVARLAAHGEVTAVAASIVHPPSARPPAARGGLGSTPEVTIVIPTLDAAGDRLRRCIAAIQAHTDAPHEIVIVDNGAPPQGFTAPVNAGLRAARGEYMVVCNDDVEVLPGWWPPLRDALAAGAPVVFPLTVDGAMREDFAAWCFGLSRSTLEEFAVAEGEFLDPSLVVWYQDTDLLQRLRDAGRPPLLVERSRITHGLSETVATADPALRIWIDAQIVRDKASFELKHGTAVAGAAR